MNYYNEIDPNAAEWTRQLIRLGMIPEGYVDERSIVDVAPEDLRGFTQCHFFSGISIWPYAFRLAEWPDDRPVWSGSCPCQPFSAAGAGEGLLDERHLWPAWHRLIDAIKPPVIFGEQVSSAAVIGKVGSKNGLVHTGDPVWFDNVQDDLEGSFYASAGTAFTASGVGAPHIRQRLYFVGERVGDTPGAGSQGGYGGTLHQPGAVQRSERSGPDGGLADAGEPGSQGGIPGRADTQRQVLDGHAGCDSETDRAGACNGFWANPDWLWCRDGKWRPVKSGLKSLVSGTPTSLGYSCDPSVQDVEETQEARVMRLKGYGNGIVAQQAAAYIGAYMDG